MLIWKKYRYFWFDILIGYYSSLIFKFKISDNDIIIISVKLSVSTVVSSVKKGTQRYY